ncbi:MAG: ABC transporter substrate-binding protein [Pseudomonadota bacterium]
MNLRTIPLAAALLLPLAASAADDKLSVLCSADMEWCQLMKNQFEAETRIKVSMIRKSAGEAYAKIRAEAANPKSDIWWGGTGDPHLQAAAEGLTEVYKSPSMARQQPWAQKQAEAAGYRTTGIYLGILGIAYNDTVLKAKNIPPPQCWKDLTKPAYKGEVEMANPNSSGAAYNALSTIVQLFGEEEAFTFLGKMGQNVSKYPNAGVAPGEDVGRGEAGVAIGFMHDLMKMTIAGFPVKIVSPCEGTGYEIGSMSIVKGAKNMDEAKKFYEFALRADVQSNAVKALAFQIPSHLSATFPSASPRLETIKTINYDFVKYGAADTRKRLLQRWSTQIYAAGR